MGEATVADVVETGDVVFLYRPRVDDPDPDGHDDVQQVALVLRPHDGGWRHLVVGQRQFTDPEASGSHRTWAFVEDVGDDRDELEMLLSSETYDTKTRGERTQPAYRPAGEGVYAIARYRDEVRLLYELELPERPGEVQRALNITPQARLVLQVRNPEGAAPAGRGLDPGERAAYPSHLQERFGSRQWIGADPPALLDYPGAEVVLVSAAASVPDELEGELETEVEDADSADAFATLRLSRNEHPANPLFGGAWQ